MDFVAGILSPFLIGFEPGGVLAFTHGCGIRKFEIRCNGYTKLRRVHVTQILFFFFFEKKNILGGRKENSTSCFALGLIRGLGCKKRKKW